MRAIKERFRSWPTMLVAALVVSAVFAGGATAAKLITGKSVKNGSLTGKDIKKRSITLDRLKGSLPAGARGATGPAGPVGPVGPATGPAGGDLAGNYPDPTLRPGSVGVSKLGVIPAVRATRASQTLTSGTAADIALTSEVFDTAGMHDNAVSNTVLRAPVAGIYQVSGGVRWQANNAGTRFISIANNDARDWRNTQSTGQFPGITDQAVSTLVTLPANGTVELNVYQDSGVALNAESAHLEMHWVGPTTTGTPSRTQRGARDNAPPFR